MLVRPVLLSAMDASKGNWGAVERGSSAAGDAQRGEVAGPPYRGGRELTGSMLELAGAVARGRRSI